MQRYCHLSQSGTTGNLIKRLHVYLVTATRCLSGRDEGFSECQKDNKDESTREKARGRDDEEKRQFSFFLAYTRTVKWKTHETFRAKEKHVKSWRKGESILINKGHTNCKGKNRRTELYISGDWKADSGKGARWVRSGEQNGYEVHAVKKLKCYSESAGDLEQSRDPKANLSAWMSLNKKSKLLNVLRQEKGSR